MRHWMWSVGLLSTDTFFSLTSHSVSQHLLLITTVSSMDLRGTHTTAIICTLKLTHVPKHPCYLIDPIWIWRSFHGFDSQSVLNEQLSGKYFKYVAILWESLGGTFWFEVGVRQVGTAWVGNQVWLGLGKSFGTPLLLPLSLIYPPPHPCSALSFRYSVSFHIIPQPLIIWSLSRTAYTQLACPLCINTPGRMNATQASYSEMVLW